MTDVLPDEMVDNQGGCEKEKTGEKPAARQANSVSPPSQEPLPEQLMKEARFSNQEGFLCWKDCERHLMPELGHIHGREWLPVSAVTEWQQKLIEMVSKRREASIRCWRDGEEPKDVRVTQSVVADELALVLEVLGVKK